MSWVNHCAINDSVITGTDCNPTCSHGCRCGMPGFDDAYTLPSDGGRLALTNVSYTVSEEAIADACSGPLAAGESRGIRFRGPPGSPV